MDLPEAADRARHRRPQECSGGGITAAADPQIIDMHDRSTGTVHQLITDVQPYQHEARTTRQTFDGPGRADEHARVWL
ncbi:hypothetical protein GCM10023259_098010 [Thermocatellispora tengchongensis]